MDFDQTYTEPPMGYRKEVIRFWWPWPHFQDHTSTLNVKLTQKSLADPILLNQMMDSGQTFMYGIIGIIKRFDYILVILT